MVGTDDMFEDQRSAVRRPRKPFPGDMSGASTAFMPPTW
jgi:hypothetical protein